MSMTELNEIIAGIRTGQIVPYLGAGALKGVTELGGSEAIPADSDSLILAMNGGQPMAPRLMYEFPRAAMNMEHKKGRNFVNRFLHETYSKRNWSRAQVHDWLAEIKPAYVIDINRDTQLQDSYADTPHTLIRGISRIGGSNYRFFIHHYDGKSYQEIEQDKVDTRLPVLFKPMGSPLPDSTFIASDADYVDYITELMGGFAIPSFLKDYRKGKQYLFLGMYLTRDTERMVLSDMIYAAKEPAGWALIPEPGKKEKRFCERKGITIINADISDLLDAAQAQPMAGHKADAQSLAGGL